MGAFKIIVGDVEDVLPELDGPFDAVACDPPYGLGFMGKAWDRGVPGEPVWRMVSDLLRPGAYVAAFGGTRTYHRLACAIEDAGFEIRDCLSWLQGAGFPKSHNFGCRCESPTKNPNRRDEEAEHELRSMRGADLSATVNPRAERGKVLHQGVQEQGAPGTGSARPKPENARPRESSLEGGELRRAGKGVSDGSSAGEVSVDGAEQRLRAGASSRYGHEVGETLESGGSGSSPERRQAGQPPGEPRAVRESFGALGDASRGACSACGGLRDFHGYGTALKPAWEPCVLAMKPLDGTFAANALEHGVAGLHVDGGRVGDEVTFSIRGGDSTNASSFGSFGRPPGRYENPPGRWPANVALDEEAAAMLDEQSGELTSGANPTRRGPDKFRDAYGDFRGQTECVAHRGADSGGASRFFYTAKVSTAERNAGLEPGDPCRHPTLKPVRLMEWLAKLLLPPPREDGKPRRLLVPFSGAGSEVAGALRAGWDEVVGIEQSAEYAAWSRLRVPALERMTFEAATRAPVDLPGQALLFE